jgi:sortase A
MNIAADRGGPFARDPAPARNWMRAAAPGIAFRFATSESSPIGGATPAAAPHVPVAALDPIRFRKRFSYICITLMALAGGASFGQGLYIYAKAQLAQVLLHAAWDRARASGVAEKPWPWADTHPLVRLIAPAQDTDVLVLAGASGRTLAFGPGHLDGSAQPGDAGNAVITAHRDTHFRFLKHVGTGDELVVERAGGDRRRFRIRRAYVADHRELRLPRDTAVPTLTLVTCYPFDALNPGGPLRYVVVAEAT